MSSSAYQKRAFYGARLEPEDGVLHGAGQSAEAFETYCSLVEDIGRPLQQMFYLGVGGRIEKLKERLASMKAEMDRYPTIPLMPQIGLSMTVDGTPEKHYEDKVAAGDYDETLNCLFDGLSDFGRPFFLRIGYECNGPWNGYPPESYIEAFRHVTALLRAHGAPAATVWCVEPHDIEKVYDWYPGDDVVDWWSVDWFDPDHMSKSTEFLRRAEAHRKPVMIGESSPRDLGTEDPEERWEKWYKPYFETIRQFPGIKSFCYINWNWTQYPMWSYWGDSRLEASSVLVER
jgi:hypothetical protein